MNGVGRPLKGGPDTTSHQSCELHQPQSQAQQSPARRKRPMRGIMKEAGVYAAINWSLSYRASAGSPNLSTKYTFLGVMN
jgi:hypothetical protein